MNAEKVEWWIQFLSNQLDELQKSTAGDLLVLRTILKAAVPFLGDEARAAIDRDLRLVYDSTNDGDPNVDKTRLLLAPLEMDVLLPLKNSRAAKSDLTC